jgi:signal peptidase I
MKTLKIITKIIYNLLFALLLVSASFILLTTYDAIPGFNFYVVMSGSMEPEIKTGSVVGIRESEEYNVNDIITVQMPYSEWETYTHRIIEIREEEEQEDIRYITQGDANETPDPDPVSLDQILGELFISIPLIGYLVHFAKQPTGFIILVIVPSVIIAASEINIIKEEAKKIVSTRKEKKKKEDTPKDKKQKDKSKTKQGFVTRLGSSIINTFNFVINKIKAPFAK